ncbi:MAG: DNA polymerase III subunit delta [Flavobacteriaceae bacterium]|nr:DNA polymerase III subunit delta [Flavobacteriaceae bacterium]
MINSKRFKKYYQVKKDIQNKIFLPFYLFSGQESFFIEELTQMLEKSVVNEDAEAFDLMKLYGDSTKINEIVSTAKLYPVLGKYRLLIVKRAQNLTKGVDLLIRYLNDPLESTVLVFCFEGKSINQRTKLAKVANSVGIVLDFKSLYDSEVENWTINRSKTVGLRMNIKQARMIREFNGNSLTKIQSILDKLKLVVGDKPVTSDIVYDYIGISRDFNVFELQKAIGKREISNAFMIAKHLTNNPKVNPFVVTLSILHKYFTKLLTYHCIYNKNEASLQINPYFLSEYQLAAKNYDLEQTKKVLLEIFNVDLRIKGIKASRTDYQTELNELISKIFNC